MYKFLFYFYLMTHCKRQRLYQPILEYRYLQNIFTTSLNLILKLRKENIFVNLVQMVLYQKMVI